jgi:CHAT domain-containing protein
LLPEKAQTAEKRKISIGEALTEDTRLTLASVREHLQPNEALLLFAHFFQDEEYLFLWAITKTEHKWVRVSLEGISLGDRVASLRCGLDATAWNGKGEKRCQALLETTFSLADINAEKELPYDHVKAFALYRALFAEVDDLIIDRHLIVVPSGPLTQLPFHVLVTAAPSGSDRRQVAWLARSHPITMLPAVASLEALRRVGRPSTAPRPMIGFGNPLLHGNPRKYPQHATWAKLAREKRQCPKRSTQQIVARANMRSGVEGVETRGRVVNLAHIKMQTALPETADELCAVAQSVNAEPRNIHLGARATEREVKRLSASGELAKYRMVHFATHGTLAGELRGTHEPGLILTPPQTASEDDDGYLSASEIAALKLDADWVVLSACNTAAGGATNAEALSGLGRAFIYAGARSLLVSHWAVYSEATQKLVAAALDEMARDAKTGRAEALRRAMLTLIDKGTPEERHPEGGAPETYEVVLFGQQGRRVFARYLGDREL